MSTDCWPSLANQRDLATGLFAAHQDPQLLAGWFGQEIDHRDTDLCPLSRLPAFGTQRRGGEAKNIRVVPATWNRTAG